MDQDLMLQVQCPNDVNMDDVTMDELKSYHCNNYFLKKPNDVYPKSQNGDRNDYLNVMAVMNVIGF